MYEMKRLAAARVKRVILKGNVGVEGKVIPCMLSLIKYVAQRKYVLF